MRESAEWFPYIDILHLPHHVSEKRSHMSLYDRAAQFAPFAALTGHDAAIEETARLTEEKVEINEDQKAIIDGCLQMIKENIAEHPVVTITYFVADKRKNGGFYVTKTDKVQRIDERHHTVFMMNGLEISIEDIYAIEYGL